MTLEEFAASSARDCWVFERTRRTRIYMRKAPCRYLPIGSVRALEIVNVVVEPQRQGHFTRFLERVEALAQAHDFEAVLVEQITNKHLDAFLARRGYQAIYDWVGTPTRWRRVQRSLPAPG